MPAMAVQGHDVESESGSIRRPFVDDALWLDAQLSPSLGEWITESLGIETVPVRELDLHKAKDFEIF